MSSATYSAPGVYVEEVPSAQQPIAGVGTNVVGFIGIVPSKVYVPVPNPDYDPVLARAKLQRDAIETLVRRQADGTDTRHAQLLLAILMLEVWLTSFRDRAQAVEPEPERERVVA